MYMKFNRTGKYWVIFLTNTAQAVDKLPFLWYNEENNFGGTDYDQRFRIWLQRCTV